MHIITGVCEKYLPLAGRILIALLFIVAGWGKLTGFSGTVSYIASAGLPFSEMLAVLTIAVELGGGVALLLGWQTRLAAWALVLFTTLTIVFFHNALADASQMTQALKNLAIVGGLLYVAKFGSGACSLGGMSGQGNSCGCCGMHAQGGTCGHGTSCGCGNRTTSSAM